MKDLHAKLEQAGRELFKAEYVPIAGPFTEVTCTMQDLLHWMRVTNGFQLELGDPVDYLLAEQGLAYGMKEDGTPVFLTDIEDLLDMGMPFYIIAQGVPTDGEEYADFAATIYKLQS